MITDEELHRKIDNIKTEDDYWEAFGEVIERYPIGGHLRRSKPNETPATCTDTINRLVRELEEAKRLQSELSRSEEGLLQSGVGPG